MDEKKERMEKESAKTCDGPDAAMTLIHAHTSTHKHTHTHALTHTYSLTHTNAHPEQPLNDIWHHRR